MEISTREQGAWNWPLLLSVLILNICLPSLVLSYGVLLVHSLELGVPIWIGLSTPATFVLTCGLSQCWCRDAADSWGGPVGYRVMATIGLLLVVSSLLICTYVPFIAQPVIYGVFAGFGSALITAQVDAVIFETYDFHLGIVRGLCFAGQAIGQSIFPHLLHFIIRYYEYSYSYMIMAGIMLQTLPAIMFLKINEKSKRPVSMSRYSDKTYAIFNDDEMNGYTSELQLHDLSRKCWKSPSDDNLHRYENQTEYFEEEEGNPTITPPPSPEEKRRNIFGVEILPEIPEESEESDSDNESYKYEKDFDRKTHKKTFSLAIKRLSNIGDSFEDYITKQIRRDSENTEEGESKEYSEVEVTYDTVSPEMDIEREKLYNSFNFRCQSVYASMRRKLRMPSYRIYRIKRRLTYFTYTINDTFIKPLVTSLLCWRFYPALMICFSKLILSAVIIVILPYAASQVKPKISMTETNFLITLHGFTWLCFLLCTPWLAQTPKRNFKFVAVIGLIISAGASYVLSKANNHDLFSIGCVVAGVGYGAITSCWETSAQDFVGVRKWPKIHSTLETVSSTLLACFTFGITFIIENVGGLHLCMFISAMILAATAVVWSIIAIVGIYQTKVRSLNLHRR